MFLKIKLTFKMEVSLTSVRWHIFVKKTFIWYYMSDSLFAAEAKPLMQKNCRV